MAGQVAVFPCRLGRRANFDALIGGNRGRVPIIAFVLEDLLEAFQVFDVTGEVLVFEGVVPRYCVSCLLSGLFAFCLDLT